MSYNTSKLAYVLPVDEDIQKAIISRMWNKELKYPLMDVINYFNPEADKHEDETLEPEYFDSSIKNHLKARNDLFAGKWKDNPHDNRPPYIHLIPQHGDSDVVQVLRKKEIFKTDKQKAGKYRIGSGEFIVPPYKDKPETVKDGTKILVPVGEFYGEYAVLFIPDDYKITPRLRVTKISPNYKSVSTSHFSLNQILGDAERYFEGNIPDNFIEPLIKTLDVAENELDYRPEVVFPELKIPDTSLPPTEEFPYKIFEYFLREHIPQEFQKHTTEQEKAKFDFAKSLQILRDMNSGKLPEDNLIYHLIYNCLSEPENAGKIQRMIHDKVGEINNITSGIKPQEIKSMPLNDKQKIIDNSKTLYRYADLHLPPYMDLTLGTDPTLQTLGAFGKKEPELWGAETIEELLKKYNSCEYIGLAFPGIPTLISEREIINTTDESRRLDETFTKNSQVFKAILESAIPGK